MGMWGTIGNTVSSEAGSDWEIGLSLIGRMLAQGDYDKAMDLYKQMQSQISDSTVPRFQEIVPEQQQVSNIPIGSEGRTAQQSAMRQLQGFIDQNGMDAQARSQLQQGLSAADQQSQANRGSVMQGMARRGMQGSGAELASLLQANQSGANSARDAGLDAAGQARQRALGALGQQAGIAGQMRGQDVGIQTNNADAERARQQFNSKMKMAATQSNNQGQNANYDEQLKRLQMLGSADQALAGQYTNQGNRTAGDWASMGRAMNYKSQAAGQGFDDMGIF